MAPRAPIVLDCAAGLNWPGILVGPGLDHPVLGAARKLRRRRKDDEQSGDGSSAQPPLMLPSMVAMVAGTGEGHGYWTAGGRLVRRCLAAAALV